MPAPSAPSAGDTVGNLNDRVRLTLGSDEIVIAESWDVQESVLSNPTSWTMELGWGRTSAALLKAYPPGTPYRLYVGGALQMTGTVDGRGAKQSPGSGTSLRFRGRDALAPLESSDITAQVTFANPTYPELVWHALQAVGIAPKTPLTLVAAPDGNGQVSTALLGGGTMTMTSAGGIPVLRTSNAANRSIKAGVKITEVAPVRTVDEYLALPSGVIGVQKVDLQGKVSESWHRFVRRYLDRAGLFLWAAADGGIILTQPNIQQKPAYAIVRRRSGNTSNVIGMDFDDDTSRRHSSYVIYSRGGGKKHGPAKAKGEFADDEMNAYGLDRPGCIRDATAQSGAEAAFLARRRLCEERRSGWRLSYTISGHTLPVNTQAGAARATVVHDTLVHVEDDELGLMGNFYIEAVRKRRGPETTAELHLVRPTDLVFGGPDT